MSLKKAILAASVLSVSLNANAALTSYTGVGGVGLVYSSVSDVTWTQDANLFKTMYDANNNLVNLITAITPSYNDPYFGTQVIGQEVGDGGVIDDFDTATGGLSWWGGIAFTNYLNSINYGGITAWRLPTSNGISGYNGTAVGNELGQLFYSELGGTEDSNIPNTPTFTNEQASAYWSGTEYAGTEYAPYNILALGFNTYFGYQSYYSKINQHYAWAVSPGQVSAVPVPGAVWLMGTSLLGFMAAKRTTKKLC